MRQVVSDENLEAAERILGHAFSDRDLLRSALTHPSATENRPVGECYERLEFLGDSVLGAIVSQDLYTRFPDADEGELTLIKISLVSGQTLTMVGSELGIDRLIEFGESERGTGSRGMRSATENVYEALVGALYLDADAEAATAFVLRTLGPYVTRDFGTHQLENPKSRLQEITQRDLRQMPEYRLVGEEGPSHDPTFTSVVVVDGARAGRGSGSSKKESEAAAALDALERMGEENPTSA